MPVETRSGSRPSPRENWTINKMFTREQARVFLESITVVHDIYSRDDLLIDESSLLHSGGFGHGPEPALEEREVVAFESLSHAGGV